MLEVQGVKSFHQGQTTKKGKIWIQMPLTKWFKHARKLNLLPHFAHYPINVGFHRSWYWNTEGQEDETRSFCDGGGGGEPQRSSKRCGFVVRYCSRNVKVWWTPGVTETMWVKQTASFLFGWGTALSTEGPSINPLSAAFLCLRFFLSWEFTSDKLGNSLRRWVFLLPSDALRAAERIQRFTNELPLYSTVCFEIFSLNLFHK